MSEYVIGDIVKVRIIDGEIPERVWAIVTAVNEDTKSLDIELNNQPIQGTFNLGDKLKGVPMSFVLAKWGKNVQTTNE